MTPPTPTPNAEQLARCSSPGCGYPDGKPCIGCGRIAYPASVDEAKRLCIASIRSLPESAERVHVVTLVEKHFDSIATAHAKELAELRERLDYQHQLGRNIAEERDTLRAQLADSQSMVEHLRLELEAHRNGTVAKEAEDMAADNARLSLELADSQKRVRELEAMVRFLKNFLHPHDITHPKIDVLLAARQSPKQEGM